MAATICLNMIVKNEGHIILETLATLCQQVSFSYWVICDTGSSDDTREKIIQFFSERQLPGELPERPWQNFAANRNEALRYCAGKADYVLIFDADDTIEGHLPLPEELNADYYRLQMRSDGGSTTYARPLLIKNQPGVRWRGVVHEFLDFPAGSQGVPLPGDYHVISRRLGARSQDPEKYLKDAHLLERAIQKGEDPDLLPRYQFYCAQSYRDANRPTEALTWYLKRAENSAGWSEERYVSRLEAGYAYDQAKDPAQALYQFQLGIAENPERAECWYQCARIHSWAGHPHLAYLFAKEAVTKELRTDFLFANQRIYRYWSAYEQALNACRLGKFEESLPSLQQLVEQAPNHLMEAFLPYAERLRPYFDEAPYEKTQAFKQSCVQNGQVAFLQALKLDQ